MKKKLLILVVLGGAAFFFFKTPPVAEEQVWGVQFSQKYAQELLLDWRETYTALFEDLGATRVKISVHWDLVEPTPDTFVFSDVDWQMSEAVRHNARVLLVIGIKTPRWPECHTPSWAKGLPKEEQQEEVFQLLTAFVERYKDHPAILKWQVENEPLFASFGDCPWTDEVFLAKEVALVRALDPRHSVVVSDSGEWSFWFRAAKNGDEVATTLYRKLWFAPLKRYVTYPFPPSFYWWKARLVRIIFGDRVAVGELQAEPWGPTRVVDMPQEEQKKSMSPEIFSANVEFAKHTGLSEFWLWGSEWWYWLKEDQEDPSMWEAVKKTIQQP